MHEKRQTTTNRRNFLRAFGSASTAAVASAAFAPTEVQAYDAGQEEMRARYQETDHVKTFYRVNRYPMKK